MTPEEAVADVCRHFCVRAIAIGDGPGYATTIRHDDACTALRSLLAAAPAPRPSTDPTGDTHE